MPVYIYPRDIENLRRINYEEMIKSNMIGIPEQPQTAEKLALGMYMANPVIQQRINEAMQLGDKPPDWVLQSPDDIGLNLKTVGKWLGTAGYSIWSGVKDMALGVFDPNIPQEKNYAQLEGLMQEYVNTDDPIKKNDILLKINALSPIAGNKFLSWLQNLVPTALIGAGGLNKIGALPETIKRASELGLHTMGVSMAANFSINSIANASEGKYKDILFEAATDPLGAMLSFYYPISVLKKFGKFNRIKGEVVRDTPEQKIDNIINADDQVVKPEEFTPEFTNTMDGLRNNIQEKINNLIGETVVKNVETGETIIKNPLLYNFYKKIENVIDFTKDKNTLEKLNEILEKHSDKLKELNAMDDFKSHIELENFGQDFKKINKEMDYIFNPSQPTIENLTERIKFIAGEKLDEIGRDMFGNAFSNTNIEDYYKKSIDALQKNIEKVADIYKEDPKRNFVDFIDLMKKSENEIVEAILDPKNAGEVIRNFESEAEKTKLNAVDRLTKDTKEAKGIYEEAEKKALEKEPPPTVGLAVRDVYKDIVSEITEILKAKYNKFSKFSNKTKALIENYIVDKVKEAKLNKENAPEILTSIMDDINKFVEGKGKLYEFDAETMEKLAEKIKNNEITKDELKEILRLGIEYKLPIGDFVKVGIDKYPKGVYNVLNQIYEKIIKNDSDLGEYPKIIRSEIFKNNIENFVKEFNIMNADSDIRQAFNNFWNALEENVNKEMASFKDKQKEEIKNKLKVNFNYKEYDLAKKKDFMELTKKIYEMPKNRSPIEGRGGDSIESSMYDAIVRIASTPITFLKKLGQTQAEVLTDLGLDIIPKLQDAATLHFKSMVETDLRYLKKLGNIVNKGIKEKKVNPKNITDLLENPEAVKDATKLEKDIASKLSMIMKRWGEIKKIYPDFATLDRYIHHDVLNMYQKVDLLLKTDWTNKFWESLAEGRKLYNLYINYVVEELTPDLISEASKKLRVSKENFVKAVNTLKTSLETPAEFTNTLIDAINKAIEKNKINSKEGIPEYYGKIMIDEIRRAGGKINEVDTPETMKYILAVDEIPKYIKYRIEAGLDWKNDMFNFYMDNILKEAFSEMKNIENLDPTTVAILLAREIKSYFGGKEFIPSPLDKEAFKSFISRINFIKDDKRREILNRINQFDKMQKSIEVVALGELKTLDPSVIKRVSNSFGYSAGNPIETVQNYVQESFRALKYGTSARIFNALEEAIRGTKNSEVRAYLENMFIDLMGRETKLDIGLKHLITTGTIPVFSELMIKHYAREMGIRNPEVYKSGGMMFVKGDVFDPVSQKVISDVEGIPAERILPKKMAQKIINEMKYLNYLAVLGGSVRAGIINLTQPMFAIAKEGKFKLGLIPTLDTIRAFGTAYAKVIKALLDPKERLKYARAGVLDEITRLGTEGVVDFGKLDVGRIILSNMSITEMINRIGTFEFYKEMNKDRFKAMGLEKKMIDYLAKEFSDTYNFRTSALYQPQILRTDIGKVVFHLGTFAYNQARLVLKDLHTFYKQMPAYKNIMSKALKQLGQGDLEGFKKTFNNMNNLERVGTLRWMTATYLLAMALNSILGTHFSSVLANRNFDYYIGDNPLFDVLNDFQKIFVGDNPRSASLDIISKMMPMATQLKRLTRWYNEDDWRYFLFNTKEIGQPELFGKEE